MRGLTRGPEAVRLDAGGVRAAVAGRGVTGQAFVVRHAACAAAAGPGAFVQVLHVQIQSVADVRLPVLLLLWNQPNTDTAPFTTEFKMSKNLKYCLKLQHKFHIFGSDLFSGRQLEEKIDASLTSAGLFLTAVTHTQCKTG